MYYSSFLAGSIVALSIGRTLAEGVAWAGVNLSGFDFGCDINVSLHTTNSLGHLLTVAVGNM